MCEVLKVSPSGYYAWLKREPSHRQQANEALLVARLMQQHGLTAQRDLDARAAPNLLAQDFTATRPDEIWLADITYLETSEGWLYLAVVMDLFTRMIVGWARADHLHATLVAQALRMALGRRRPTAALLHHSHQGSQYTSTLIQTLLAEHHIQVSMSGVGNCYDNAPMESFFARLKTECPTAACLTRAAARLVVFEHIEVWYNRQRLHSALGYLSPVAFEQRYYENKTVR